MTLSLFLAFAIGPGGCHEVVDGGKIMGRHLAAVHADFLTLPADLFVGYAPRPGSARVFRADELARLSKSQGLAGNGPSSLCLAWAMQDPVAEDFAKAMRESVGSEVKIEVLEMAKQKLPTGKLVFPAAMMSAQTISSAELGFVWRGFVLYGENQRYSTWARVRLTATYQRVIATQALRKGEAIRADQVRLESVAGFPLRNPFAGRLEDVVGRSPAETIAEGAALQVRQLVQPEDVIKGQIVEVNVIQGMVRCKVEGKAETGGKSGDFIMVRNLTSGKVFRATVENPGKVFVK